MCPKRNSHLGERQIPINTTRRQNPILEEEKKVEFVPPNIPFAEKNWALNFLEPKKYKEGKSDKIFSLLKWELHFFLSFGPKEFAIKTLNYIMSNVLRMIKKCRNFVGDNSSFIPTWWERSAMG